MILNDGNMQMRFWFPEDSRGQEDFEETKKQFMFSIMDKGLPPLILGFTFLKLFGVATDPIFYGLLKG